MTSLPARESQLRHPWEIPIFIASVTLNLALIAAAVFIAARGDEWLRSHHVLSKYSSQIRAGAIAAILTVPALALVRNNRLGFIRGNSIRLSQDQFGPVYEILEEHCCKLGMPGPPELYLTDRAISTPAQAFSAWGKDYIVLRTDFLDSPVENVRDVLAFTLGCELGRLRLGHASWWNDVLLTFIGKVPVIRAPLSRIATYSRDRYGAFLAPEGLRGLLVLASGRRVLKSVNINDYLTQVSEYGGFWARLAGALKTAPHLSYRIQVLWAAGFWNPERDQHRPAPETRAGGPNGLAREKNPGV
jgi:hypothetical protein